MTNSCNGERDEDSKSTHSVRNQYDWGSTDPSIALVESVAEAMKRDKKEIASLYNVIDPDAVNRLLTETTEEISLTLTYQGQKVSLHGTGKVTVEPD